MRVVRSIVGVLIVSVVAMLAIGVWWWQHQAGMNLLERWCARELRRTAGELLVPTFEFSSLNLDLPVTVTLDDVTLCSDGVTIIKMSSLQLEFGERPKRGRPLVIQAATFVDPQVRLIGRSDGTLQGFGDFVRSSTGTRYQDGGSSKPSDFLAIRRLALRNGMFEWAPFDDAHPMRFDKVAMDITASPDPDQPGKYSFKAKVERPPVIQLTWDGAINIDTGDLALDDTMLQVDLSEDHYNSLTPSIQDFLRRYSIVGDLAMHIIGHVPLGNSQATDLTFDASLHNASAAVGAYQFPIDSADLKATFRQMKLSCDPLSVRAFGGRIDTTSTLGFADREAFMLDVSARDVLIQDMLRPAAGTSPRFAGKFGVNLNADGERKPEPTMKGTGTLTIAEGRLINIPLFWAMAKHLKMIGKHLDGQHDRGEVDFTIASDRATIDKLAIQSTVMAARATGDIHYNGRLDLRINSGVIEKTEAFLGKPGDIMADVTDRLLPFKITGTWSDPIVTPYLLDVSVGHKDE